MPNVLVLSFEGFSFSSRQLYQHLLVKLLSRAVVHESLTIQDALNYISSGWPTVILVTDAVVTLESEDSIRLLDAVVDHTKEGCITVLMGFFSAAVEPERLDAIFKDYFDLRWKSMGQSSHRIDLFGTPNFDMIRKSSLISSFDGEACFLGKVPAPQIIYTGWHRGSNDVGVYAAYTRVGLGKLGYIGDVNYGEEPERLILAMCHLDRPE
ncbi:hypothetical protein K469DRAFT_495082, partial [Zopfia rhizophila CBS 207.26]